MSAALRLSLARALLLIGLAASIALLLDSFAPSPAFCGLSSGCSKLRESGYGQLPLPGGATLSLPLLGVTALASLFVLSLLWNQLRIRRVFLLLSGLGALSALGLLALQAWLGTFCWLCLTVDSSVLAAFLLAVSLSRKASAQPLGSNQGQASAPGESKPAAALAEQLTMPAWLGLLGITILAPIVYSQTRPAEEVPGVITALYRPDEVTVVEFFDYQCPHCRALSPRLKKLVAEHPGAALRYGYTPLPGHTGARSAARIAICAAEQGAEEVVSAAFFEQTDFAEAALLERATALVDDPAALEQCLASQRPDQRIEEDTETIKRAGFVGLPTTYVGSSRILGAADDQTYRQAMNKARAGQAELGISSMSYWGAILLLVLVLVVWGRRPQGH